MKKRKLIESHDSVDWLCGFQFSANWMELPHRWNGEKWSSVKLCGRCHQSSLIGATARLLHWPKCKSVCRAALMPLILFLWLLCYRWKWRTAGQQCIPPAVGIIWLCTARARLICLLFFFIPFLFVFSFRTKQITHTDGRTDGLYYFSILFFLFWSFAITVCRLGDLVGSSFRCYGPQIDQRQRFDSPFRLKKFGLYFSRLFMAVK